MVDEKRNPITEAVEDQNIHIIRYTKKDRILGIVVLTIVVLNLIAVSIQIIWGIAL